MTMRPGTEQKLLDAAEELFFARGIAATPIDAVLERAGVSSATLYRGYPSKESLVAAALRRRHDDWLAVWDRAIAAAPDDRGRLLAVFDALDDYRATPTGSRWCAFLGTAAEYVEAPEDLRAVLDLETGTLRQRLRDLADPLVGADAGRFADQLLVLVSGSLAMRLRDSSRDAATAREIAAALLDARAPAGATPTADATPTAGVTPGARATAATPARTDGP